MDPGIPVSQNRAKIKTVMSWKNNRDESVNIANVRKEVSGTSTLLQDRKTASIRKKSEDQQILPASTMKLSSGSWRADLKHFRKPAVLGHSKLPHLNTPDPVSSKRKLKEKTHFTEINWRVTDHIRRSSLVKPFPVSPHGIGRVELGVQWPGGRGPLHPSSRPGPLTALHLLRFVSPTFGQHPLLSAPISSRHTGPLLASPYFFVRNRGSVIQHFPLYW